MSSHSRAASPPVPVSVVRYLWYGVALVSLTLATVFVLSLDDCSLPVEDCGEDRRGIAFVVLCAGAVSLVYLLFRFFRDPPDRR